MNKTFSAEFVFELFALLIAIIVVHTVYVAVIWPNAEVAMTEMLTRIRQDPNFIPERSVWVLLKDYEQESCIILMFWALSIMGYKARTASRERAMLGRQLVPIAEGLRILPEDARAVSRQIESLPDSERNLLLPRALLSAVQRFGATGNIQDVSAATHTLVTSEAERLESELSMLRYVLWAIPCIGFIGTVRGISDALALAYRAAEGDLTGVTDKLAVGFNSTLIALVINIFLMFLVHQLQLVQERLVFETEGYLDEHLIRHLKAD